MLFSTIYHFLKKLHMTIWMIFLKVPEDERSKEIFNLASKFFRSINLFSWSASNISKDLWLVLADFGRRVVGKKLWNIQQTVDIELGIWWSNNFWNGDMHPGNSVSVSYHNKERNSFTFINMHHCLFMGKSNRLN